MDAVDQARALARELYLGRRLGTGEDILEHAEGMVARLAELGLDSDARVAALLFAAHDHMPDAGEKLAAEFGAPVAALVANLHRLKGLRPLTEAAAARGGGAAEAQAEILRKMLLAMADDIRVVLLRLASRTQTLRWLTGHDIPLRRDMARESLEIYAPLANRLGVWQMKWEIEDLSFRFIEPETYKRIAKMLDEKRAEREAFIESAIARLKDEMAKAGVNAEVYGRPKHIYSIRNKMRAKNLDFSEVYDVRALRVIVPDVRDCYTALGIVHALWQPVHGEFDDYISHPKGNDYRSLHTAVMAEDGRPFEVQIRTREMHSHAELGVAAHWRYKESGTSAKADSSYDDKIAWLRQLLSWRDEITDSAAWVEQFKRAALDDTIYVMTPQGRVIDLPRGATPIDFAYRVHTDLGHRCRGAKVDGHLVPLSTSLANGQRVEIVVAKTGGPSRDWLQPGHLVSPRARQKVKAWFAAQAEHEPAAAPAAAPAAEALPEPEIVTRRPRAGESKVLVVGVDKLLTQLGRCCKPVPPDAIAGFVTRGRGVSVHRTDCANFRNMAARNPERVIDAQWGAKEGIYATDLFIEAHDRQGLLRDISDVLSKEKINVTAVKTQSKGGMARMGFTVELSSAGTLQRIMALVGEVAGVTSVRRG
ncbi:MAG: bifunctional (p)ppGpp synthetase/guanosine-3',5'-bis(diphosphate) 3'-pyrophosphohydrolase [Candidatus Nitricoxidivorans perseverans]|uniref:GTP pyrophosphokinase n=1 Tax=Candidatus Nitricoxidivorans perseverans TaxID=2975601 RepID=A0AA49FLX8_9PROT|nr:MAG: bifunctional (p)ppGpp synthetase/guanosine-3',5'-bis(diphosphate) 3'-pyrophosphohydrolase [Candidatus Nitricoxidivorans perseverans]